VPNRSPLFDTERAPPETDRTRETRFWRTAAGFWRLPGASAAWFLTAVLISATVLQLALQYRLNYWSRDFFDAFGRRDAMTLRTAALLFPVLASGSVLLTILSVWARMTMQRKWRASLTRRLIDRWLANPRFLRLRFQTGEDRNPEYRIAEDVRVATDAPVSMATGALTALLNAVTFISILWNVGGDLTIGVFGGVINLPKYLVITVVIYSGLLTLAMTVIGRRMVHVIAGKNAAEAQFRSIASDLRERGASASEMIAGKVQHLSLIEAFDVVQGRWQELCLQFMRTTFVSYGNILMAPVIAWILCAPKYLVGSMSLGESAQVVAAFVMVQSALNWLVDNYPALAECLSSVNRVSALLVAMDELDNDSSGQ
jgi:putative ATP-binding cassette transporter